MPTLLFHPKVLSAHPLLYPIVSPIHLLRYALTSALAFLLDILVTIAVVYVILHRTGILKRLVRKFAEHELSKIANGAQFTIGDIELDILKGEVHVTDLIAHTPNRSDWQWNAPCIARAGTVDVTFNCFSCLDYVGPFLGFPVKDIHTVKVNDVQVFVEKRRNVFNFHLLDPSLDLPVAEEVMESLKGLAQQQQQQQKDQQAQNSPAGLYQGSQSSPSGINSNNKKLHDNTTRDTDCEVAAQSQPLLTSASSDDKSEKFADTLTSDGMVAEDKANEIVSNVLGVVSTIGKAANEGGKEGLHTALNRQKAGFVSQLKELKTTLLISDGKAKGVPGSTSLAINVMKHMGKAVEKNVGSLRDQVDSYQKPPPKKPGWKGPPEDERFRFGCIVARDVRIFLMTQKSAVASLSSATSIACSDSPGCVEVIDPSEGAVEMITTIEPNNSGDSANGPGFSTKSTIDGGWSKPIRIKELAISGAELCPPLRSSREDRIDLSVGLPIDKVVDIITKRLIAEAAKSNGGRVLHTAFGEVFSWMDTNPKVIHRTIQASSSKADP